MLPAGSVLSAQRPLSIAVLATFRGGAGMRMRVTFDGFNLYYGALKGTSFKWFDPARLSAQVRPGTCVIDKVLHFAALVSGLSGPGATSR